MLECKKCNGQYSYINGSFYCKSCGDFADTNEEIRKFTLELYNNYHLSDILTEGKISFLGGKNLEDNPYKKENEDLGIVWEEGWKEGQVEHDNFVNIQGLEEEDRELNEEILKQAQIILDFVAEKKVIKKHLLIVLKGIFKQLFPFKGKLFRFGQSEAVDDISNSLSKFIDEIEGKS